MGGRTRWRLVRNVAAVRDGGLCGTWRPYEMAARAEPGGRTRWRLVLNRAADRDGGSCETGRPYEMAARAEPGGLLHHKDRKKEVD